MEEESCKSSWDSVPEMDEQKVGFPGYVVKRPIDQDYLLVNKFFLPFGIGPDIDCEIDEDNDEPDFLSYSVVPKVNLDEDSSTPRDAYHENNF